jgi:flagellar biosynthesis/type III secretory pathway protein FliH
MRGRWSIVSDEFVQLAALLRRLAPVEPEVVAPAAIAPPEPERSCDDDAMEVVASQIRRFRAHLSQAFDGILEQLLRDLACDVLARELALAPVEIATVAANCLTRVLDDSPLRLRTCSEDGERLVELGLPVVADPALRSGDVIVELRDGELDLRLGVRLEAILREYRPQ